MGRAPKLNNQPKTGRVGDGTPGPGRPKGAQNKTTIAVKQALIEAFDKMGGVTRLTEFAKEEPAEFYKLWVKILPQEIGGIDGAAITVNITRLSE